MSEKETIQTISVDDSLPSPEELQWAFPDVDPGMRPYGGRVIVQLRRIKKKLESGLILVSETKENEKWNNMIGKVVSIGPLAFRNRDTMQPWAEGSWAEIGDFVRVPKWGGDRWERVLPSDTNGDEPVLFMTLNDHELIAEVTGNPLSFKAYV